MTIKMKNIILVCIVLFGLNSFSGLHAQNCNDLSGIEYISNNGQKPLNWPGVFEFGTLDGRLLRDGLPSGCGPLKPCPGNIFDVNGYHEYRMYNNSAVEVCVTIMLNTDVCATSVHLFAVLEDFNSTDACPNSNFLGDVGSSLTQPFSFTVPPFKIFTLVAQQNFGGPLNCQYRFTISTSTPGAVISCPGSTVPTLGQWGLIILSLSLMAIAMIFMYVRHMQVQTQYGNIGVDRDGGRMFVSHYIKSNFRYILKLSIGFYAMLCLVFAISVFFFGYTLTGADLPCGLIASFILALNVCFIFDSKK